jgi:type II secretory pathway pseudopilin PulG
MVELLVVVAVVAVLAGVLLPALSNVKAKAMRGHCVGNLKNVGLAHRIFATDNGELFPWERSLAHATNGMNFPDLTGLSAGEQVVRIYRSLSNELSTPIIIACPADLRHAADDWGKLTTNNISYFVGLSARESLPRTFLAGDRNLVLDGKQLTGRAELKSSESVAWDKSIHRFQGVVATGDGSVHQLRSGKIMSFGSLKEALGNTGVERNVLLIP